MKKTKILIVSAFLLLTLPCLGLFATDKMDFQQGDFRLMTPGNLPPEWVHSKKGNVNIVEENGQKFLRLENIEPAYNELLLKTKIPNSWEAVKISARFRAKEIVPGKEVWYVAKIQTLFFSSDSKIKLTDSWPCIAEWRNGSMDWTNSSIILPVPGEDNLLQIQIAMYNCTGSYDIEYIQIEQAPPGSGFKRFADGKLDFWGKEPIENLSSKRARVILNGPWRFVPVVSGKEEYSDNEWGLIWVPGNWRKGGYSGVSMRGKGDIWKNFDGNTLAMAWYQRDILIPKEWEGRSVILEIDRISTDAVVFINGSECGKIGHPFGEIDLAKFAKFGEINDLKILVKASLDRTEDWNLMGIEAGQVHKTDAKLATRGIIGEVFLLSRPRESYISDVFIQTSTRKKELKLDVELAGVKKTEIAKFAIEILGPEGKIEKAFSDQLKLEAKDLQNISLTYQWENPKLWDFKQPNLYILRLKVEAEGISDDYKQTFGFREFWIEGKDFFLNGTKFRLRPNLAPDMWGDNSGITEYIEGCIKGMMDVGFNFAELWPWDHDKRGEQHFRRLWAETADRLGFPISGVALSVNGYIVDFSNWEYIWDDERKAKWTELMVREMRKYRNHPSILMWATSANFFGQQQDQNPRFIGIRDWYEKKPMAIAGLEAVEIIKKIDPTRPVFTHHGADIGDVHTCNNYLCMIPLQEREEWLSHWAEHGQMPYIAIEFGTPLYVTFHRGRCGYGNSSASEPLYTEWAAVYFGTEAYKKETESYRKDIVSHFKQEQEYSSNHGNKLLFALPSHQDIQSLFIRNTWRAWRTWGLSGGMIPWENAQRWEAISDEEIPLGPFKPGKRGSYFPVVKKTRLKLYDEASGWKAYPSATELVKNNSDTLAWIAGSPIFTDKTHNFKEGSKIAKQIVLINDSRISLPYSCEWKAEINGEVINNGNFSGEIMPAQNIFIPIGLNAPNSIGKKSDGKIILNAVIGNIKHNDEFKFTVFPILKNKELSLELAVYDPAGETSAMLKGLAYNLKNWDEKNNPPVLIIGRKAFSIPGQQMLSNLEKYVSEGGKLVIFAQNPDFLQNLLKFRVAKHLARRVFPVNVKHPICEGITADDLQDWAGESNLIEAYPMVKQIELGELYGWRWGNRGAVASCAIEKPHHSSWTPILECEWDLAYSPLMELAFGKGFVVFCGLDLEDNYDKDPVAEKLARRLINYVSKKKPHAKAEKTVCFGNEKDFAFLDSIGLLYEKINKIPENINVLLIVGSNISLPDKDLEDFLLKGGKIFFLSREGENAPLGVKLKKKSDFCGSLNPPDWVETNGLSASDLRARVAYNAYLVDSGVKIGADGMIGLKKDNNLGLAMFCQINPTWLNADEKTYLRYTRWRHTRAISQLLANLGATFSNDNKIFNISNEILSISLAGEWKAKLVTALPPSKADNKHKNIFSKEAKNALKELDISTWQTVNVPGIWEKSGNEWASADGEAVFRKTVEIPEEWKDMNLQISLGTVDDYDDTFWNGEQIGGIESGDGWNKKRIYLIPAKMVKIGKNEIAVRIFDHFGGGGFTGRAEEISIEPLRKGEIGFYHPDYRKDFDYGDDPYRYYRW